MKTPRICDRFCFGWTAIRAALLFLALGAMPLPAQTFNTLFSFDGTNGGEPLSSLVQGTNGNYYGTTSAGGLYGMLGCSPCAFGGTVFEITPAGSLTTLYNFCAKTNCTDGSFPSTALVETVNGTFWGTTQVGGALNDGTIFKVSAAGSLTTLHSFDKTDGEYPVSLILARDGNFYGTTFAGGSKGAGTVFKITPTGTFAKLHDFCQKRNCTDGSSPAGIIQASDGNLYGTAASNGSGVLFKITTGGKFSILYGFSSGEDGSVPGTLLQATDGNIYGTAGSGNFSNTGTFFKITLGGAFTLLYDFCSLANCADGRNPEGPFVQAMDGNFYGTTNGGLGDSDCTAFEITPTGTLTTLYPFDNLSCDAQGLMQATNGTFYGATYFLGSDGVGTIYSLSTGLGPFAQTVPTSAKVGSPVVILGNNLTGTTSVKFNGTTATFTVVSDTEIKTDVPTGASTGYVTVTTPTVVLNSNVQFQVNSK